MTTPGEFLRTVEQELKEAVAAAVAAFQATTGCRLTRIDVSFENLSALEKRRSWIREIEVHWSIE